MVRTDKPVALITGGGSGIGLACARHLARRGWSVVAADLDRGAADTVAEELGEGHLGLQVDVTDENQVDPLVARVVDHFGRIDGAVNSAGVLGGRLALAETPVDEWRRVMAVNADGVFLSMRAEINAMRATGMGGAIVNVASIMGVVGSPLAAPYVASKHAVVGMTRAAAWECAENGIRINAVGPGYTDTPLLARPIAERSAELAARHAFNRVAEPEEIASAIWFLLSEDSRFITGAFLPVDGGYTAR